MDVIDKHDVFQQFVHDSFDVKDFASQSIHGVGIADQLSQLAEGIAILDKELRQQVCAHYEALLSQATAVETLEEVLRNVHIRIHSLLSAVERLRLKIVEPYQKIRDLTATLSKLQAACDLIRCVVRVSYLSKRLQSLLEGGSKDISKCAQTLSELDHLMDGVDLSGLEIIAKDQKLIRQARKQVDSHASDMLYRGIEQQNQAQVATALQVFYNFGNLASAVRQVVNNTQQQLEDCLREAVDLRNLNGTINSGEPRGGAPGRAVMPTPGNAALFRTSLWSNMEKLTEQIYVSCARVQHLQKVLAKKRDPVSHVTFSEELARTEGTGDLTVTFWNSVTNILTKELVRAANESTFVKQAFEGEYPKLLRLYSDLWRRLQNFGDCNLSASKTHREIVEDDGMFGEDEQQAEFDPESALRQTLFHFENAYLSRSLSRLFDPVNVMFSSESDEPPTADEVESALQVVTSELTVAAVDPHLAMMVARNVTKMVHSFVAKSEQMLSTGGEASQVIGPPTRGQTTNAAIVDLLHLFDCRLLKVLNDVNPNFPREAIDVIKESLKGAHSLMEIAIQPLLSSIEDAIESIILTMHDEDFSMVGQPRLFERNRVDSTSNLPQCSLYMRELQTFIARVQSDYMAQFKTTGFVVKSMCGVANRALNLFVRHAAMVRPLGDGGKQRLAADCAQMELCLIPICPRPNELGKSYRMLRAFRPLLFQTPEHIVQSSAFGDTLSYSCALHILFSRAPPDLRSPHQTAGWSIAHYSKWLDSHPQELDRLEMIKGAIDSYVHSVRQRQGKEYAAIYPSMLLLLKTAGLNV